MLNSSSLNGKTFNSLVGHSAENIARDFLKGQGYRIVKMNYTCKIGEIDIIAYDGATLVFVEVKYKKDETFGLPREMVTIKKQRKIRNVATVFINSHRLFEKQVRFDVVEILGDQITLLKDCF